MKKLQQAFVVIAILILMAQMSRSSTIAHDQIMTDSLILCLENEELESSAFSGYNLFIRNELTEGPVDRKILISNLNNDIIYEKPLITNENLLDIELYNSTTILYGSNEGVILWNFETNVTVQFDFTGHHEIEVNYLNDTFLTLVAYDREIENVTYNYDLINEYDSNGDLVRSIDTRDFVEPWQLCPYVIITGQTVDITHANSFIFDEEEKAIYLNCRNLNTFYKIDYVTGEVIWGLGEYGNFTLYDIYGNPRENLFYHSHALDRIDKNTFILFDNDYHNQTDALNQHSRYVEITIDEEKMCANTTWEWIGPIEYWSPIWGDCNRLANQNRLGVFSRTKYQGDPAGSRVVEVDNEGKVLWEYVSPYGETIYSIYRIERIRLSPIVSRPSLKEENQTLSFEWQIWYNFKSKTNFTGKYYLYLDNHQISTGDFIFPKYWEPIQLNYSLDMLGSGKHTISLIVEDEGGHLSNESAFYPGAYVYEIKNVHNVNLDLISGIILPIVFSYLMLRKKEKKKRTNQSK